MMTNWLRIPLATVALAAAAMASGVKMNWTPSLPVGLYLVRPLHGVPARGVIVEACLPDQAASFAVARGYVAEGSCPDGSMPVLKPAMAVPGDLVEVGADGVRVNGARVVPPALPVDGLGRPLEAIAHGARLVPTDAVWLLSGHEVRSFDSRYFGAVPVTVIRSVAWPLLTF